MRLGMGTDESKNEKGLKIINIGVKNKKKSG